MYAENVESQNSANAVRRIYKNMSDTHYLRRVKLFKDAKIEKTFKLLMSFNEESKRHINSYKQKHQEAKIREKNLQNYIKEQVQRRNREGSSCREREGSASSRARNSLNRDMTPNKMGKANLL